MAPRSSVTAVAAVAGADQVPGSGAGVVRGGGGPGAAAPAVAYVDDEAMWADDPLVSWSRGKGGPLQQAGARPPN